MLCTLIYNILILLYLFFLSESAIADIHKKNACQASLNPEISLKKIPCGEGKIQNFVEDVLKLKDQSLQLLDTLKEDKEFGSLLSELQNQVSSSIKPEQTFKNSIQGDLYVFVSFSMGETALLNLAQEAKEFGATLILRGFKEKSYKKTAKSLQKIIEKTGQGFLIDPELYTLFNITSTPTYVLTKKLIPTAEMRASTPIHDRIQGHVSIRHALETFAKSGDLHPQAKIKLEGEKK